MGVELFFFFQAEDGIRDDLVTGVQTCALPICGLYTRLESETDWQEVVSFGAIGNLTPTFSITDDIAYIQIGPNRFLSYDLINQVENQLTPPSSGAVVKTFKLQGNALYALMSEQVFYNRTNDNRNFIGKIDLGSGLVERIYTGSVELSWNPLIAQKDGKFYFAEELHFGAFLSRSAGLLALDEINDEVSYPYVTTNDAESFVFDLSKTHLDQVCVNVQGRPWILENNRWKPHPAIGRAFGANRSGQYIGILEETIFRSSVDDPANVEEITLENFPTSTLKGRHVYASPNMEEYYLVYERVIAPGTDRKSTRLNSSHQIISYAVFCLKKKKKIYIYLIKELIRNNKL